MAQFDAPEYAELHELLERQCGVASATQLAGLGVTREFMRKRVIANRWQRLHRGVYAMFSGPLIRDLECLTAVWPRIAASWSTTRTGCRKPAIQRCPRHEYGSKTPSSISPTQRERHVRPAVG